MLPIEYFILDPCKHELTVKPEECAKCGGLIPAKTFAVKADNGEFIHDACT